MTLQGRAALTVAAVITMLLMAGAVFAAYGWLKEHDARIRVESRTTEQQKDIDALKEQQEQAQITLSKQLAALEQEKKQPVTPPQFVVDTAKLIPDLPKPLEVREIAAAADLPDGPRAQEVVIPAEDLRVIRDAQVSCQEKGLELTACGTERTSLKQQLGITETQRDEWKTAARGGHRWHRAVAAAKWFAIGAGAGYAGYAISHR